MNKFKNQKAIWQKYSFRSNRERDHAWWLEDLKSSGAIKGWIYEVVYALRGLNGKTICKHAPDFTVTYNDGTIKVHEIKAPITKTAVWSVKKKLFEDNFPEIEYLVFDGKPKWKIITDEF